MFLRPFYFQFPQKQLKNLGNVSKHLLQFIALILGDNTQILFISFNLSAYNRDISMKYILCTKYCTDNFAHKGGWKKATTSHFDSFHGILPKYKPYISYILLYSSRSILLINTLIHLFSYYLIILIDLVIWFKTETPLKAREVTRS